MCTGILYKEYCLIFKPKECNQSCSQTKKHTSYRQPAELLADTWREGSKVTFQLFFSIPYTKPADTCTRVTCELCSRKHEFEMLHRASRVAQTICLPSFPRVIFDATFSAFVAPSLQFFLFLAQGSDPQIARL